MGLVFWLQLLVVQQVVKLSEVQVAEQALTKFPFELEVLHVMSVTEQAVLDPAPFPV